MRDCIVRARSGCDIAPDGQSGNFEFCFSAGESLFLGHFPQYAVLPGVFQIEMTRMAAEWTTGAPLTIAEIVRAKFLRPILPGRCVVLRLLVERNLEGFHAEADLSAAGEAAGRVELALVVRPG